MRQPRRLPSRMLIAVALAALLLPAAATAALAKEGLMVAFDAPIAMDTPPGTEILVGMTVTALTEDGEVPVYGSPIVLVLTGRHGDETEAHGVEDPFGSGHYVMRIAVPPGGARKARVVMRGMSSDGPADIELVRTSAAFTFGGVTAGTAQVAPAATPALTPFPRATAVPAPAATAAAQVPAAPAPEAGEAPSEGTPDAGTWWLPAIALVGLGLAVVIALRLRVARRAAPGT